MGVPERHKDRLGVTRSSQGASGIGTQPPLSTRCQVFRAATRRSDRSKRQYRVNEAERDELIASRRGVCCICPSAPATHVDHRHNTGRVRGVLCFSCNAALGQFKGRPDVTRRAVTYLEGNAWKPILVAPGVYQLPS
jgi:hypothetical protein